ncbi:hypothetical protein SISNIDRAFT_553086 [Sistotremastrum niveocremeum HHB9708]|uniref:Uncharacterized protein n=1 Tax=Sistotremastrum niveocremeum HHB9708 TaxID=1314777 RepID=A0A164NF50_9AGAM|nr:hypothetical protein SISNIDRAFT_553086 [Sistotremastrum niveocremeum HHB9708]
MSSSLAPTGNEPFLGTPTVATTTQSQTASPSSTPAPSTGGTGSELYLFTFLTTLLLLLGVSCAIIVRSLVLRRRFRRRVQEAIANGIYVPGMMGGSHRRDIGEKPTMWEAWIGSPESSLPTQKKEWTEFLPVAAVKPVSGDDKNANSQGSPYAYMPAPRASRLVQMFTGGGSRRSRTPVLPTQSSPSPAAASSFPMAASPSSQNNPAAPLQLSVLIAMPSPSRPHHRPTSAHNSSSLSAGANLKGKEKDASHSDSWHGLEEGEIPHIEFGVLELPYRGEEKSEES